MFYPHAHIPYNKISEYIGVIRKERLNLEIYISAAVLDNITKDDVITLKKRLDFNPSVSIHAPFIDLSPAAIDSLVRKVTMERFSHVLSLSEILHARAIVFHSGYEKWKYALHVNLWLEKSLITWHEINKRAYDAGIKVAIENIFEEEPSNLKLLMENMSSDNFGVCFDTGHFNLFSKVPIETWMDSLNPYIVELHLHDNDRTSDQHLPVGDGTFDFQKFFSLLQKSDVIHTIEGHTPENVIKSIEYLKKILPGKYIA